MNDDTRRVLLAWVELAGVIVTTRLLMKAWPTIELYMAGAADQAKRTFHVKHRAAELEREWRRDRSGVLFEAWLATREAADNGAD